MSLVAAILSELRFLALEISSNQDQELAEKSITEAQVVDEPLIVAETRNFSDLQQSEMFIITRKIERIKPTVVFNRIISVL